MAIRCFEITEFDFIHGTFKWGSFAWDALISKDGVITLRRYGVPTDIKLYNVKPGDYVVITCAGNATNIGFAKIPKDQRLAFLWKKGFRKNTRIHTPDVKNYVYEELGGDFTPSDYENGWTEGSWRMHGLTHLKSYRPNGEIAFYAIYGRVNNTNDTITRWYMNPDATLNDIREAFGYKDFSDHIYDMVEALAGRKEILNDGKKFYLRTLDERVLIVDDQYDSLNEKGSFTSHYHIIVESEKNPTTDYEKYRKKLFDCVAKELKVINSKS